MYNNVLLLLCVSLTQSAEKSALSDGVDNFADDKIRHARFHAFHFIDKFCDGVSGFSEFHFICEQMK